MNTEKKLLLVTPEKCISCGSCELACSFFHEGEFRPSRSRISVMRFETVTIPMTCLQCDEPACVAACRGGALSKDSETGIVSVNKEKCIGCRMCEMACPFGNITYNAEAKSPDKCDLCGGDPQCVKYCPANAIEFVSATSAKLGRKKLFSAKIAESIGEVNA